MMICTKCNFQNNESARFCKNCGAKLVEKPIEKQKPKEKQQTNTNRKRKILIPAMITVGIAVMAIGYFVIKNSKAKEIKINVFFNKDGETLQKIMERNIRVAVKV